MEESKVRTLTERERQERLRTMVTSFLGVLLLYMSFWVVYHLTHELNRSDLITHLRTADDLTKVTVVTELLGGRNRLWHVCVWFLMRLGMAPVYAACVVTSGAIVSLYGVYCGVLSQMLKKINRALIPVAAFVLCIVGPLYMPWYSEEIYRGQDSPNMWHNPTQLMVRPLAILVFWMTVRIYQRAREGSWPAKTYASKQEAGIYTLLITLSVWAKPSFVQVFIPALGIVLVVDLVRSKGKSILFFLKVAAAYVPGVILTLMQFVHSFLSGGGNGVEIAPFDVWSRSSNCIPISICLLYAFPIFVLLIVDRKRYFSSLEGQISASMFVVSGAMWALLAEVGPRRYHGNFGWSWALTSTVIWCIALRNFIDLLSGDRLSEKEYRVVAGVGWTLLFLHFFTGIVYYCHIATGTVQC